MELLRSVFLISCNRSTIWCVKTTEFDNTVLLMWLHYVSSSEKHVTLEKKQKQLHSVAHDYTSNTLLLCSLNLN